MRIVRALVVVVGLMFLAGCGHSSISFTSMNTQRAGLRDAADISATLAFDNVSDANIDVILKETKDAAHAVTKFLNSGNVGDLTSGQLRAQLASVVPYDYQSWVDLALNYVSQYSVDPGRIGNKTVSHLKEFFYGVTIAVDRYKKSDRPETNTRSFNSLEADRAACNEILRKRMR